MQIKKWLLIIYIIQTIIALTPLMIYLIYILINIGEKNMDSSWISAVITGVFSLIGVIISGYIMYKISKITKKDKNGENTIDKISKIGNPKETLASDHDIILEILKYDIKKPLSDVKDNIISFTSEQKISNEYLKSDKDSLKDITNSIIKDRIRIEQLNEKISFLEKDILIKNDKIQTLNKEIKILNNKNNIDKENRDYDIEM